MDSGGQSPGQGQGVRARVGQRQGRGQARVRGGTGRSPRRSCRRHCSGSSAGGGRSGRWRTTSCGPGCPARPHSCTAAPGSRPPCPHPHPLWVKAGEGAGKRPPWEDFPPQCLPAHPPGRPAAAAPCQPLGSDASARGPTSGEDARVHEGGHAEVGQDEEEDDAIVDRNGRGHSSRQPWAPASDSRTGLDLGPWRAGPGRGCGDRGAGCGRGCAVWALAAPICAQCGSQGGPAAPLRTAPGHPGNPQIGTQLTAEDTEARRGPQARGHTVQEGEEPWPSTQPSAHPAQCPPGLPCLGRGAGRPGSPGQEQESSHSAHVPDTGQ